MTLDPSISAAELDDSRGKAAFRIKSLNVGGCRNGISVEKCSLNISYNSSQTFFVSSGDSRTPSPGFWLFLRPISSIFLTRFLLSPVSPSILIPAGASDRFVAGAEVPALGYEHSLLLCAQALQVVPAPSFTPAKGQLVCTIWARQIKQYIKCWMYSC